MACANGSEPLPQAPAFFLFDDAYALTNLGAVAGYLTMLAMGLPSAPQETAVFCATGAPTDLPTSADYLLLTSPPLALISGAYGRFGNQIRSDKWQDLCQCSAATPSTCASMFQGVLPAFGQSTYTGATLYVGNRFTALANGYVVGGRWYVPTGTNPAATIKVWDVTAATVIATASIVPAPNSGFYDFMFPTPAAVVSGSKYVISYDLHSGSEYLQLTPTAIPFVSDLVDGDVGVFTTSSSAVPAGDPGGYYGIDPVLCEGAAGTPYVSPDPPDPPTNYPPAPIPATCGDSQSICDVLALIIARLDAIGGLVTLIQRQEVPFAYVHGTAHSGLTGTGELSVQGLIGARVELTTVSTVVGEESGTPLQSWQAGWISWGNADGFSQREFVSNESLLSIPAAAGQYTRIGYTLSVGVVATITELVRES